MLLDKVCILDTSKKAPDPGPILLSRLNPAEPISFFKLLTMTNGMNELAAIQSGVLETAHLHPPFIGPSRR